MTPELRQMIDYASDFAEKNFRRKGQLCPMYHAVKRDGEHMVMPAPAGDKDTSVAMVKAAFELFNVRAYVFMDEAWTIELRGREIASTELARIKREGASKHPDRREAVMFIGEDAEGMVTARRFILRPEHGRAKLMPLEFTSPEPGMVSEGRMVGLLPRPAGPLS